jgi:CubicO group peptidase (beta-lactamase class C family)
MAFCFAIALSNAAFSQNQVKSNSPSDEKLKKILSEFEQYAQAGMKQRGIPGMTIAVVKDGKIVYSKAFGVKTAGTNTPVNTDTVFQIGSTSKAFTSCLVAMLVDEGKLSWDDRVIDHLPGFTMYDPWVTREFRIKDLMAQRSGLTPYAGDMQSSAGFSRDHIISSLQYIKPASSFRSEFAYQNSLFLAAAKIVELKTGKTWEENVKERILTPLGMKSTTMGLKPFQESNNAATPHICEDGKAVKLPDNWKFSNWAYIYGPAGGINSNINDMSIWINFHINKGNFGGKQLVSQQNINYLHQPKTIAGRDKVGALQSYCEGWVCREYSPNPIIWHNGGTTGCNTMVALIPEEKIGIVILSNMTQGSALADALAFRFFDMYFDKPFYDWNAKYFAELKEKEAKQKKEVPVKPSSPAPALPVEICKGEYSNPIYGNINIIEKSGNLFFFMGPIKMEVTMKPWNGNIYSVSIDEMEENAGFATFDIDPDGKITGLTLSLIERDGCGKFVKVEKD